MTADEAVAASRKADAPLLDEAKQFLQSIMATGPTPVEDIQKEAKGAGLSWDTVKRAKDGTWFEIRKGRHDRGMGMETRIKAPRGARKSPKKHTCLIVLLFGYLAIFYPPLRREQPPLGRGAWQPVGNGEGAESLKGRK